MKPLLTFVLLVWFIAPGVVSAQTSNTWTSARTNNLFLISNAGEQELRKAAVWLEVFHEAFGRLLSRSVVDSSVPTTVILFKDDASFIPFKPLYQGRPASVAGYFQPGRDVNYIVLSLERGQRSLFGAAFHEYVHLHVKDNAPNIPLWLNEGLAEFYGAFRVANGEAIFGSPHPHYLQLLRNRELLPLADLFSVAHNSPHYNEDEKSGVFYAQSWALVHYLMMGEGGRLRPQLSRFIGLLSAGVSVENAVQNAFNVSMETLEKQLRNYVFGNQFASQHISMGQGPNSYIPTQTARISEAEANYYLGDLLLHIGRIQDAEKYFLQAISLDPNLTSAHASLGLLRVQQNRLAEARKHLQRATTSPQTHLIHYYYAWVLSTERSGPNSTFAPEVTAIMREELRKAIKLAPKFADAYYLLAFINVVNSEQLEEAVKLVKQALALGGNKPSYSLMLAFAYLRQQDIESARPMFESLARQTSDSEVRVEAQRALESIESIDAKASRYQSSVSAIRPASSGVVPNGTVLTSTESTPGGTRGLETEEGKPIVSEGEQPSVEQIIGWWVEAIGGEKALRASTTRVAKGTIDVVGVSRGGSLEIYSKAPNKTLTMVTAEPLGQLKLGFNGRVGWEQSIRGFRILRGVELSALKRDSDYYSPATLHANYQTIKLLGKSRIGYVEVYVLELKPAMAIAERLYIDANTHFPIRLNATRTTSQGSLPVEIYFDDWRDVDGLKIPFRVTQRFPSLSLAFKIEEVQHDVPLNDAIFESPVRPRPVKRR